LSLGFIIKDFISSSDCNLSQSCSICWKTF